MIGKTISHYKILEELGRGGMGVVYKAEDTRLKRTVALKFLPKETTHDPDARRRFIQEAEAAAALDHPHICTIHEIDEAEDRTFIAMAYIEGQTLKEKIRQGPLEVGQAVDIAIQVAEGLQEAHERGIVHRDIKPANIMLTQRGQARIMDFGLAKLVWGAGLTRTAAVMGTAAYMSPEQARGETVDLRTDIWALGAVLYEMLSGRLPFKGDYEQAVVYSILNEDAETLTSVRSSIPRELEIIVNKAMAKNPDNRYQHVRDLLVDLQKIESLFPAQLPVSVAQKPTRKRDLRRQALIYGIPALLLLLISVFLVSKWTGRRSAADGLEKKIAVLPFDNLTADPDQEYFCDGMTEQIITNLSRIPELKVIARTSVMRYKDTRKDIREISQELGAPYILEGSVRKSGKRLRITAQLIQADEGVHLWANDYDQELQDVFVIQDYVSQSIARSLEVTFSDKASRAIAAGYPRSIEAYDYYLKARHYIETVYLKTKKEEDFRQALALAKRAVELDPEFALGYLGIAFMFENHLIITGDEKDLGQEKIYVEKAYELNPELPEINAAMGLQFLRAGDYERAFSFLKKALELTGNDWGTFHIFGIFCWNQGLYQQAAEYYSKALELNPLNIYSLANRGWSLLLSGELDRALVDFEKAVQIQPSYPHSLNGLALTLVLKQKYEKADEILSRSESQPPGIFPHVLPAVRALYYAAMGEKEKALAAAKWGGVLALLGMKTEALDFIEITTKDEVIYYFLVSYLSLMHLPIYDSLRDELRFQEILKREKQKYETRLQRYAVPLNN